MDVKGLAGTWDVIWKHSDKSLERRLGKRGTIIISRQGVFQVVQPFTGQRVILAKSTNAAFPASAGWYQRRMEMLFIRCNEKGKLEIHYFDNSPGAPCNRRYKNLSRYCVGGIGTIRTISSTITGTKTKRYFIVKLDFSWDQTCMTVCLYKTPKNRTSIPPTSASVLKS